MAKSARASSIKKNKSGLKKRVFGPVERARNDRLNSKLLAIINQEKPLRAEMEVETAEAASADTEAKDDGMLAHRSMAFGHILIEHRLHGSRRRNTHQDDIVYINESAPGPTHEAEAAKGEADREESQAQEAEQQHRLRKDRQGAIGVQGC